MFGEEKYLFGGIEGKKENIFVIEGKENNWWRKTVSFCGREENLEGKGGKCLDKEDIFFEEEKKTEKEKEKNTWSRKISFGRRKMEKRWKKGEIKKNREGNWEKYLE